MTKTTTGKKPRWYWASVLVGAAVLTALGWAALVYMAIAIWQAMQ